MQGYVQKALVQLQHIQKGRMQQSPSPYKPSNYGAKKQLTLINLSPAIKKRIKKDCNKSVENYCTTVEQLTIL